MRALELLKVSLDYYAMLYTSRHYLLVLLMLFAWAQTQVVDVLPVTQAMQSNEHCGMSDAKSANASELHAMTANKAKTDCSCCEKQCVLMHCAAVHLQVILPLFNVSMPFVEAAFTLSRFSQVADTYYFRPPTPPPNALQS